MALSLGGAAAATIFAVLLDSSVLAVDYKYIGVL